MNLRSITCAFVVSVACFTITFAQGTNNDFPYDDTDLNFLFTKLGFGVFKFPVTQNKNQIIDFRVEEYRGGILIQSTTALEVASKALEAFGIDAKAYAVPKMDSLQTDSVYFHRFYTERTDSLLTINVKSHGVSTPIKFDVKDLYVGNVRARFEIKEEIDEKGFLTVGNDKLLMFFYANNNENEALWCPAGMSKQKVIEQFYYAVFVTIIEDE